MSHEIDEQVEHLVNNMVDDWATDIDADNCHQFTKKEVQEEVGNMADCDHGFNEASKNVIPIQPQAIIGSKGKVNVLNEEQPLDDKNSQHPSLKDVSLSLNIKKETCLQGQRHHSCPPRASHSINSGPWSIEWLQDHVLGDAGVVSSSKPTFNFKSSSKAKPSKSVVEEIVSKDCNSGKRFKYSLKHSARNLKKIARLHVDDRKQILKILMKKAHRRRGVKKSDAITTAISKGSHTLESSSSASVNNDWKH